MQVVLNVKGSFRTTGGGHNREVVALYKWPLVQVPLSSNTPQSRSSRVYILLRSCNNYFVCP